MSPLERRYRKLLMWYPKGHRVQHEEEMIAVLLAGAMPDQNRPSARDTFDLLRGGLSIHLYRAVGPESRRHWHDAVNIAALLAPIVLLLLQVTRASAHAGQALRGQVVPELALHAFVFALPYALIALLAWLGRRKTAAACAWGWMLLYAWLVTSPPKLGLSPLYVVSDGVLIVVGVAAGISGLGLLVLPICLCAAMLTLAPSPGSAPVGTGRLLGWLAAVFAVFIASTQINPFWGGDLPVLSLVAATGAAAVSPTGRRAVIALLPLASASLAWVLWVWLAALSVAVVAVTASLARTSEATSPSANP